MTQRNEHTQPTVRHTLKADERLKRRKHIDTLFSQGKAYSVFPVTIKYLWTIKAEDEIAVAKAGFSVSKKKFKHAVKRNKVKRMLREAWRTHKYLLDGIGEHKQLHVFFIYTSRDLPTFTLVKNTVVKLLEKLNKEAHA